MSNRAESQAFRTEKAVHTALDSELMQQLCSWHRDGEELLEL